MNFTWTQRNFVSNEMTERQLVGVWPDKKKKKLVHLSYLKGSGAQKRGKVDCFITIIISSCHVTQKYTWATSLNMRLSSVERKYTRGFKAHHDSSRSHDARATFPPFHALSIALGKFDVHRSSNTRWTTVTLLLHRYAWGTLFSDSIYCTGLCYVTQSRSTQAVKKTAF